MKVFAAPILFLSLISAEALAQSTTFQHVGLLAYEHLDNPLARASFGSGLPNYYASVLVDAPAPQTTILSIGHVGRSNMPPLFWPHFPSYGTPGFRVSLPFAYRSFDGGTLSSDGVLQAFQIAASIGLPGFDRPALNRVQNLAVRVMRHYGWKEAVRVNRECVRSLSCSGLYEKSAVQRIALGPPN